MCEPHHVSVAVDRLIFILADMPISTLFGNSVDRPVALAADRIVENRRGEWFYRFIVAFE